MCWLDGRSVGRSVARSFVVFMLYIYICSRFMHNYSLWTIRNIWFLSQKYERTDKMRCQPMCCDVSAWFMVDCCRNGSGSRNGRREEIESFIYELIAIIAKWPTQYANQTQINHLRLQFSRCVIKMDLSPQNRTVLRLTFCTYIFHKCKSQQNWILNFKIFRIKKTNIENEIEIEATIHVQSARKSHLDLEYLYLTLSVSNVAINITKFRCLLSDFLQLKINHQILQSFLASLICSKLKDPWQCIL